MIDSKKHLHTFFFFIFFMFLVFTFNTVKAKNEYDTVYKDKTISKILEDFFEYCNNSRLYGDDPVPKEWVGWCADYYYPSTTETPIKDKDELIKKIKDHKNQLEEKFYPEKAKLKKENQEQLLSPVDYVIECTYSDGGVYSFGYVPSDSYAGINGYWSGSRKAIPLVGGNDQTNSLNSNYLFLGDLYKRGTGDNVLEVIKKNIINHDTRRCHKYISTASYYGVVEENKDGGESIQNIVKAGDTLEESKIKETELHVKNWWASLWNLENKAKEAVENQTSAFLISENYQFSGTEKAPTLMDEYYEAVNTSDYSRKGGAGINFDVKNDKKDSCAILNQKKNHTENIIRIFAYNKNEVFLTKGERTSKLDIQDFDSLKKTFCLEVDKPELRSQSSSNKLGYNVTMPEGCNKNSCTYKHSVYLTSCDNENISSSHARYQKIPVYGSGKDCRDEVQICDKMPNTAKTLKVAIKFFRYSISLLLIILVTLDIVQIVASGNLAEVEAKKKKQIIYRVIVAIVILTLPLIVHLLISILNGVLSSNTIHYIDCLFEVS